MAIVYQNGVAGKICANPERYEEATRRYLDAHREDVNTRARERRQEDLEHDREMGRDSCECHTEEEWQELKAFYNFKCLCCGAQEPDLKRTRDHVIPLTQGGSDSIDNVQPLCARCNSKKSNKQIDYRRATPEESEGQ